MYSPSPFSPGTWEASPVSSTQPAPPTRTKRRRALSTQALTGLAEREGERVSRSSTRSALNVLSERSSPLALRSPNLQTPASPFSPRKKPTASPLTKRLPRSKSATRAIFTAPAQRLTPSASPTLALPSPQETPGEPAEQHPQAEGDISTWSIPSQLPSPRPQPVDLPEVSLYLPATPTLDRSFTSPLGLPDDIFGSWLSASDRAGELITLDHLAQEAGERRDERGLGLVFDGPFRPYLSGSSITPSPPSTPERADRVGSRSPPPAPAGASSPSLETEPTGLPELPELLSTSCVDELADTPLSLELPADCPPMKRRRLLPELSDDSMFEISRFAPSPEVSFAFTPAASVAGGEEGALRTAEVEDGQMLQARGGVGLVFPVIGGSLSALPKVLQRKGQQALRTRPDDDEPLEGYVGEDALGLVFDVDQDEDGLAAGVHPGAADGRL